MESVMEVMSFAQLCGLGLVTMMKILRPINLLRMAWASSCVSLDQPEPKCSSVLSDHSGTAGTESAVLNLVDWSNTELCHTGVQAHL